MNSQYDPIKAQIKYMTGAQEIICPHCQKNATAHVSGAHKEKALQHRIYRRVRTACRHCGTIYTFDWFRS